VGAVTLNEDEELVSAARGGSREAAGELFERHWAAAWRAAFALTGRHAAAEDVVQDAFERAFRALTRFDGRRPFAAWLHRIVVNAALNRIRADRRLVALDDVPEPPAPEPATSGVPSSVLLAGVASLSPERRAVVVLRYGLEHSLADVADILEIPLGTVQSRLHRALADLRCHFEVDDARA
jgi:RNA polymerase sigma-70 factor, ECF subfamily